MYNKPVRTWRLRAVSASTDGSFLSLLRGLNNSGIINFQRLFFESLFCEGMNNLICIIGFS